MPSLLKESHSSGVINSSSLSRPESLPAPTQQIRRGLFKKGTAHSKAGSPGALLNPISNSEPEIAQAPVCQSVYSLTMEIYL